MTQKFNIIISGFTIICENCGNSIRKEGSFKKTIICTQGSRILYCPHCNNPIEIGIMFEGTDMNRKRASFSTGNTQEIQNKILDYHREHPEVTAKQLSYIFGIPRQKIYRLITGYSPRPTIKTDKE